MWAASTAPTRPPTSTGSCAGAPGPDPAAQHPPPIVAADDAGRISGVIPRVTLLAAISEQNQEAGEASETTEAEGADA